MPLWRGHSWVNLYPQNEQRGPSSAPCASCSPEGGQSEQHRAQIDEPAEKGKFKHFLQKYDKTQKKKIKQKSHCTSVFCKSFVGRESELLALMVISKSTLVGLCRSAQHRDFTD